MSVGSHGAFADIISAKRNQESGYHIFPARDEELKLTGNPALDGRKTTGFLSIFPSNPMPAELESGEPAANGSGWVPTAAPWHTLLSLADL